MLQVINEYVMAMTFDEFKKTVETHMKNELDIMEMIFSLDRKDVEQFNEWYINHPYCKG